MQLDFDFSFGELFRMICGISVQSGDGNVRSNKRQLTKVVTRQYFMQIANQKSIYSTSLKEIKAFPRRTTDVDGAIFNQIYDPFLPGASHTSPQSPLIRLVIIWPPIGRCSSLINPVSFKNEAAVRRLYPLKFHRTSDAADGDKDERLALPVFRLFSRTLHPVRSHKTSLPAPLLTTAQSSTTQSSK